MRIKCSGRWDICLIVDLPDNDTKLSKCNINPGILIINKI